MYNQAINSMDNWVGFFYQNTNKDPFYNIFTFTFFLFTETFLILTDINSIMTNTYRVQFGTFQSPASSLTICFVLPK